jgi:hypothetical protein
MSSLASMDGDRQAAAAAACYNELLEDEGFAATREKLAAFINPAAGSLEVLSPFFIGAEKYRCLLADAAVLVRGIRTLAEALLRDESLRQVLRLSPADELMLGLEPEPMAARIVGRLDSIPSGPSAQCQAIEYNGGVDEPFHEACLYDVLRELPVLEKLAARFTWRFEDFRDSFFSAYAAAVPAPRDSELPVLGMTPDLVPFLGAYLTAARARGAEVVVGGLDEFSLRGGRLFLGATAVQMIALHSGHVRHFLRHPDHPVLGALRERIVQIFNGYSAARILGNKTLFALLSEPLCEPLLDPEALAAVRRHVPWTRILRPGPTDYHGETIDLLDFARAHRERLVLKSADGGRGLGVFLGRESTPDQWTKLLRTGLSASFIIQEHVEPLTAEFPCFQDGHLVYRRLAFDFNPYVWAESRIESCLVRVTSSGKHNCSLGAASVACMVIESTAPPSQEASSRI